MTAVTSTTDFDYEFDAAKGIQRDNLPPFAQRMRKAADLVWEEGYQQPFIRELGKVRCNASVSRSICCRIFVM